MLNKVSFISTIVSVVLFEGILNSVAQSQSVMWQNNSLQVQTTSISEAQPEVVAQISQGPGNITITPDNRIIVSLHQFYEPRDRVIEVSRDGMLTPFPNVEWARGRNPDGTGLDTVLGIQSDPNGVV